MNTTKKKTIPQIMMLMLLKTLKSFLMSLEVVFPVKKQTELEINSIKAVYNFLKEKDSLANKEKNALKNNDRYPQKISKQLKNLEKHF